MQLLARLTHVALATLRTIKFGYVDRGWCDADGLHDVDHVLPELARATERSVS